LADARNADDGSRQHLGGVAHRFRERAPQVERKMGIAVVGQSAPEAVLLFDQGNSFSHLVSWVPPPKFEHRSVVSEGCRERQRVLPDCGFPIRRIEKLVALAVRFCALTHFLAEFHHLTAPARFVGSAMAASLVHSDRRSLQSCSSRRSSHRQDGDHPAPRTSSSRAGCRRHSRAWHLRGITNRPMETAVGGRLEQE
jgi:hypothetical protein